MKRTVFLTACQKIGSFESLTKLPRPTKEAALGDLPVEEAQVHAVEERIAQEPSRNKTGGVSMSQLNTDSRSTNAASRPRPSARRAGVASAVAGDASMTRLIAYP